MAEFDASTPGNPLRGNKILSVFDTAFGELLAADPAAFRVKFRKMAASAFAFYRGTACLFYADLDNGTDEKDAGPYLTAKTARVWIHGDLHAENFGTYLDANGRLIFNVNDFDEAFVGPFTWDLKRFAASVALIGYTKALADDVISHLVTVYATAYRERIGLLAKGEQVPPLTLDTADGPLLDALRSARTRTRVALLDSMTEVVAYDRRFTAGGGAVALDEATKAKVLAAFGAYLETLPEAARVAPGSQRVKDVVGRRGVGIGSAGLPSYNLLLEGNTDALENDVVIYMKQGQTPAVARHITDPAVRGYFRHEGHRTVISQRALQAHADPWLGWTELDGVGQLVAEVSPYAVDLDWSDLDDPAQIEAVIADLGRATATMHAAADSGSGHSLVPFSTENAIDEAIGHSPGDLAGFAAMLVDFAHTYGARARADHQIFVDLFRNGRIPGL